MSPWRGRGVPNELQARSRAAKVGTLEVARRELSHSALNQRVGAYRAAGKPDLALKLLRRNTVSGDRCGAEARGGLWFAEVDPRVRAMEHVLEEEVQAKHRGLVDAAVSAAIASGRGARRPFRIARAAALFAHDEGLSGAQVAALHLGAVLADVGMIAVPPAITSKAGRLTHAERARLQAHTHFGARLVEQAGLEVHQTAVDFIRFHHERWDGSGPCGLKGEEIPVEVRIIALADALEAITHPGPWSTPLSFKAALSEIESDPHDQFDPAMAVRFVAWAPRDARRSGWTLAQEPGSFDRPRHRQSPLQRTA